MKECFGKEYINPKDIIRKCGVCGVVRPQKEMVRDDCSDTGWICTECDSDLYPDFDSNEF